MCDAKEKVASQEKDRVGQPQTVVSWVGSLGEKRQERNFQPGVSVEKIRMVFHPLFLRMLGRIALSPKQHPHLKR